MIKKLAVVAGASLLAMAAQAGTVTYNFTNPFQPTEISQSGTLGLFDSTLGTLTGATLVVDAGIEGTIHLQLGGAATGTNVRGTTNSDIGLNSSLASIDALFNGVSDVALSFTTGWVAMTPNSTHDSATLSDSDSLTFSLGLAGLSQAGGGNFSLSCDSLSSFTVAGGAGFSGGSQTTYGRCGASITYTYDDAPRPTSPSPRRWPSRVWRWPASVPPVAAARPTEHGFMPSSKPRLAGAFFMARAMALR